MQNAAKPLTGQIVARSCDSFLAYWNFERLVAVRSGAGLAELSSNQLGRVGVGDRIWIVGPSRSAGTSTSLTLIGHIDVSEKHERDAAGLVEAPMGGVGTSVAPRFSMVASNHDVCRAGRVELPAQLWRQLRFWSGGSQIAVGEHGKPDVRYSLQTIRRLTGASGELLARAWVTAP
jgi:hypothetical protein